MPQVAQYAVRVSQEMLNFDILSDHRLVMLELFFTKIITESNKVSYLFRTIVEFAGSTGESGDVNANARKFNGSQYTELEMLKLCHHKCLKIATYLDVLSNVLSLLGQQVKPTLLS